MTASANERSRRHTLLIVLTSRRWTEIHAVAPPPTQPAVGLHSLGHTILSVSVNGIDAQHTLSAPPDLAELNEVTPATKPVDVAEQAYFNYLAAVSRELQPDLVIQLPAGWTEQQQQQEGGGAPSAGGGEGGGSATTTPAKGTVAAAGDGAQQQDAAPMDVDGSGGGAAQGAGDGAGTPAPSQPRVGQEGRTKTPTASRLGTPAPQPQVRLVPYHQQASCFTSFVSRGW